MVEVRQEARVRHLRDAGRLTLPNPHWSAFEHAATLRLATCQQVPASLAPTRDQVFWEKMRDLIYRRSTAPPNETV